MVCNIFEIIINDNVHSSAVLNLSVFPANANNHSRAFNILKIRFKCNVYSKVCNPICWDLELVLNIIQ